MTQKIHFISYGNDLYKSSKERIRNEAQNSHWFDSVNVYGPEILEPSFSKRFSSILSMKRGGGYWIWKSYIIHKRLQEINDDDILVYLDAGCTINIKGETRFREYLDMLNKQDNGIVSFQTHLAEKMYTVKEIFQHFNVELDGEHANTGQYVGGIMVIKKNTHSIKLINMWLDTLYNKPDLFTDKYNKQNQQPQFRDNRHDQSVFSIIRKIHKTIVLKDESWVKGGNFGNKESLKYPFWATRKV